MRELVARVVDGSDFLEFKPRYGAATVCLNADIFGLPCGILGNNGPIDPEVLQEDAVLPFRALLERGIRVIDEPLVEYRIHDANLFAGHGPPLARDARRRWARNWLAISNDWRRSWNRSGREDAAFAGPLGRKMRFQSYEVECYDRSRAYALLAALRGLTDGLTLRNSAGLIRRHVLRRA